MSFSLNEVEATAKRATRGAGYSWGLAEEASKATRWLCANGFDGAGTLARLLDQTDAVPKEDLSVQSIAADWTSSTGQICPLIAGATLADSAAQMGAQGVVMHNVLHPAFVLPFAAAAAKSVNHALSVNWDGQAIVCDATGLCDADAEMASTTPVAKHLTVTLGGSVQSPLPKVTRATPNATDWAVLNRFAHRTFAPATDASRLLGAGAGVSDND